MLFVVCCSVFGVRCVLLVDWCSLCVVCCSLFGVRCLLFADRSSYCVICCLLFVDCWVLRCLITAVCCWFFFGAVLWFVC